MLEEDTLISYYKRLRMDHRINYDQLTHVARNLKTLQEDIRRGAINFFTKTDSQSDLESQSDNSAKNLVGQMLEKISQIECQPFLQDKSLLKKRWWTPEEDDKLKQLVD